MIAKLDKVLTLIFSLFWILIIFIDYWYYHPEYASAIQYFQYADTLLILSIVGIGVFFGVKKLKEHKWFSFLISGSGIFILFILTCAIILWTHFSKVSGLSLEFTSGLTYLGKISYILFCTYLVFAICYVLGALFINNLFSFSLSKGEAIVLKIAMGITLLSIFLVVLGFLNLLTFYAISVILVAILGVGWKETIAFLKTTMITTLDKNNRLNWLGFVSFYLLLIFISLNFLSNVRPFPFGFDALAVYLNLPNLLSQQHGLIAGYSPYYWSLFVAMGHIVFDKLEIVIALSIGGGILSLFVIYEISKKWLNVNFSILTALLFYSLPLVNYQSYRDVKTDLGLLFIMLTVVLILINWLSLVDENSFKKKVERIKIKGESLKTKKTSKTKDALIAKNQKEEQKNGVLRKYFSEPMQFVIILGILSGMSIGIKLTGLITIFAILSVFSFIKGGKIGFLANFFLTFFIVLMGDLDTSLRPYHFGTDNLRWVALILGLIGLGYVGYKRSKALLSLVKTTLVYIAFIGMVYLPWPIKNYKETGNLSIKTFIEGKSSAPSVINSK